MEDSPIIKRVMNRFSSDYLRGLGVGLIVASVCTFAIPGNVGLVLMTLGACSLGLGYKAADMVEE